MMLCRLLVMWVSRLRARFQGLQIQWLSSPLEQRGRLGCVPGPPSQATPPQDWGSKGTPASPKELREGSQLRGWRLGPG